MAAKPENIKIVACYSSISQKNDTLGVQIFEDLSEFIAVNADYVVLALRDVSVAREILLRSGVPESRILSFYNNGDRTLLQAITQDTRVLNKSLGMNLRLPAIASMTLHPKSHVEIDGFDYVRNTAFELMGEQVSRRRIEGAVAELGVYRGDQAKLLSELFPEKKLYLFDTFEGFSSKDLLLESGNHAFSTSSELDFSNTSVSEVMGKMKNPERIVLKKGFFPDTAEGLDERYCFVSLDVDLYAPIRAGLEYFYPRLSNGGCIFIHDYNNIRYKGVKSAVDEFQNSSGCCAFPLPDCAGSIIVLK